MKNFLNILEGYFFIGEFMTGPVENSGSVNQIKYVSGNTPPGKTTNAQPEQRRNDQELLSSEFSQAYIPGTPLPKKTSATRNLRVDQSKLPEAFAKVEADYTTQTGKPVTDSSADVSTYDLLKNHMQPYDIMESKYRTGKEKAFMSGVQQLAKENKATNTKIMPEDLYRIALEVNDGDRFKALVTVHDSLKMTGRAYEVGTAHSGEDTHIKDMVGEDFFNNYINTQGGTYKPEMADKMGEAFMAQNFAIMGNVDDYTGNYYHMFGTAASSVSGEMADLATYGHASLVNFGSVKGHFDEVYGTNESQNKVIRTVKDVGSSMSAVLTGGFFWGRYTTERPDKWSSDKTGLAIADRLKANRP